MPNTRLETPAAGRRLRGQGRQPLWQRPEQVSVIVLPLVVDGIRQRRRLEKLFAAMHSIRRALQREVRKQTERVSALCSAPAGPTTLRNTSLAADNGSAQSAGRRPGLTSARSSSPAEAAWLMSGVSHANPIAHDALSKGYRRTRGRYAEAAAKTRSQRTHACPACGLGGNRDLVSATFAAFTILDDPGDPTTARVDYDLARRAQRAFGQRLKAAVAESTVLRSLGATAVGHRPLARREACLCSAEYRSLCRADLGWEHGLKSGKPRAQPGLP